MIIKDLSQALNLSPTPIREALARLSGEGLVEERRGAGYFAPQLGVTELAELYEAHQALVLSALREPRQASDPGLDKAPPHPRGRRTTVPPTYLEQVERLFDAMVRLGGNRPLFDGYRRIADRLAPARQAESLILDALEEELAHLRSALDTDLATAVVRIRAFHKRRLRVVQDVVRVIRGRMD